MNQPAKADVSSTLHVVIYLFIEAMKIVRSVVLCTYHNTVLQMCYNLFL